MEAVDEKGDHTVRRNNLLAAHDRFVSGRADLVPEARAVDDHTVECRIDPALSPPATLVTALARTGIGVESCHFHPPWSVQLVPPRNVPVPPHDPDGPAGQGRGPAAWG